MQLLSNTWNFIASPNSSGFATLLAGSVALLVYIFQKRDKKISAARILFSEIRTTEQRIDELRTLIERGAKDYPKILPTNSWNKHSYLFASDFTSEQLDEINNFYTICEQMDLAAFKDNNYFWLTSEYISKSGQDKAADLIIMSLKKNLSIDMKKLEKLRASVLNIFSNYPFMYSPQKTVTILNTSLSKLQKLTTSPTGLRLQEIAKLKPRSKFWLF